MPVLQSSSAALRRPTTSSNVRSFSVRDARADFEYNGTSLNSLFAQRSNLLRPAFWRMLRDILRFNREAPALLAADGSEIALGDYLEQGGYTRNFVERYIIPMGAAIWSTDPERMLDFPAQFFVRRGCIACHSISLHNIKGLTTIGPDLTIAVEDVKTRFGRTVNGVFDPLESLGGSLLQDKAIDPAVREFIPKEANTIAHRQTPPLFGLGLLEAIPDDTLKALALRPAVDGVVGKAAIMTAALWMPCWGMSATDAVRAISAAVTGCC